MRKIYLLIYYYKLFDYSSKRVFGRNKKFLFFVKKGMQNALKNVTLKEMEKGKRRMPANYAHRTFGEAVYAALPQQTKALIEGEKELFDIGIHGPDILFFHKAPLFGELMQYGNALHTKTGRIFFTHALDAYSRSKDKAVLAYILGVVCHYALDSICHSYVMKKQTVSGASHTEIEMEFDRKLLVENGGNPAKALLVKHVKPSAHAAAVIAQIFEEASEKEILGCLYSMRRLDRLLLCPTKLKRWALYSVMKLVGKYEPLHSLVMSATPSPACTDSSLRLKKLYNKTVSEAVEMIAAVLCTLETGAPLPERFDLTFEHNPGWEQIPVMSYEEELACEV